MTTVEYKDEFGNRNVLEEIYAVPLREEKRTLNTFMKAFKPIEATTLKLDNFIDEALKEKQDEIVKSLKDKNIEILSVKSQYISKRRYKRRTAKILAKHFGKMS
jgi:hypothetical protein